MSLLFLLSAAVFNQELDAKKKTGRKTIKSTAAVKTESYGIIDPDFMIYEESDYNNTLEKYGFELIDSYTVREGADEDCNVEVFEKEFDGKKIVISKIDTALNTKYKIIFPDASMRDGFISCIVGKGFKKDKGGLYINKNSARQATVDGLTVTFEYYIHNYFEDFF